MKVFAWLLKMLAAAAAGLLALAWWGSTLPPEDPPSPASVAEVSQVSAELSATPVAISEVDRGSIDLISPSSVPQKPPKPRPEPAPTPKSLSPDPCDEAVAAGAAPVEVRKKTDAEIEADGKKQKALAEKKPLCDCTHIAALTAEINYASYMMRSYSAQAAALEDVYRELLKETRNEKVIIKRLDRGYCEWRYTDLRPGLKAVLDAPSLVSASMSAAGGQSDHDALMKVAKTGACREIAYGALAHENLHMRLSRLRETGDLSSVRDSSFGYVPIPIPESNAEEMQSNNLRAGRLAHVNAMEEHIHYKWLLGYMTELKNKILKEAKLPRVVVKGNHEFDARASTDSGMVSAINVTERVYAVAEFQDAEPGKLPQGSVVTPLSFTQTSGTAICKPVEGHKTFSLTVTVASTAGTDTALVTLGLEANAWTWSNDYVCTAHGRSNVQPRLGAHLILSPWIYGMNKQFALNPGNSYQRILGHGNELNHLDPMLGRGNTTVSLDWCGTSRD